MGVRNGMRQSITDSARVTRIQFKSLAKPRAPMQICTTDKPVKEVWLEQVARQTPGIDSYFVTNSLTSLSPTKKRLLRMLISQVPVRATKAKVRNADRTSLQDNDYKNFSRDIVIDQMVAKNSLHRMGMP